MKVLALETSSASAGVAVARDGQVIAARRFVAPRGRGAELFAILEEMRGFWRDADRLAVGVGPGSYNGLRVACAVAGSMQMALGMELVTAPSCCLLDVSAEHYRAMGDARGGRVWLAEVARRQLAGEIELLTPDEGLERARASDVPVFRTGEAPGFDEFPAACPDATALALLAPALSPVEPSRLEPIYLKPPHITLPRTARP